MTKTCTHCQTEKPLDDFYKCKTSIGGHKCVCKPCFIKKGEDRLKEKLNNNPSYREKYLSRKNESTKRYYKNDEEIRKKRREYQRLRYHSDPEYRQRFIKAVNDYQKRKRLKC